MRYIFSDLNAMAEYMDMRAQSVRYNARLNSRKDRDLANAIASTWENSADIVRNAVLDTK